MTGPRIGALLVEAGRDLTSAPWAQLRASVPMNAVLLFGSLAGWIAIVPGVPFTLRFAMWLEDELMYLVIWGLLSLVLIPAVSILLPYVPLGKGMLAVQLRWLEDGEAPTARHAVTWGLPGVFRFGMVAVPVLGAQLVAMWAGLVPAIVIDAVFGFALPAMVVHRLGPAEAVRVSVVHFASAPLWRLGFSAALYACVAGATLTVVPLLWFPALYGNLMIRGYRAWFGTGPIPRPL